MSSLDTCTGESTPERAQFAAMGTKCEVVFYEDEGFDVAQTIIAEVLRIEQKYSRYLPASYLSSINRAAAVGARLDVDEETAALLDYAQRCYELSGGLFDITSGALRRAWDFRSGKAPDPRKIEEALKLVGWEKLVWKSPTLSFPLAGMQLDIGGLGKEYAVDRACDLARHSGLSAALVDLGGDIGVIGPRPGHLSWSIGVQNPTQLDVPFARVSLMQGALASSGGYERYVVVDGKRCSHLLNPRTGWPLDEMAVVSVIAPQCLAAGTFSTIAMLKGAQGPSWLDAMHIPYASFDRCGNQTATPPFVLESTRPRC